MDQQEIMVQIMKEEWAGLLIDTAHPECDPEKRLPRLEELLGKILVKVKKAVADTQPPESSTDLSAVPTRSDEASVHEDGKTGEAKPKKKKKVKICENLGNLGIYTHSEHFGGFEAAAASKPSHIFSISEKDIIELHKTKKVEMMKHNRDYFMRAYPAAIRIDSSNLDPSVFWRKGVQMVALNWQEIDEGMMLNEGMFHGEHGWVLKPSGFRSDDEAPPEWKTLERLYITVYAAQHLPMEEGQDEKGFHPYVKCELHVETGEDDYDGGKQKEGEYKAKIGDMTTDHPDWGVNGQILKFENIEKVVEELTFVR
jgi:phosphatidylinositol phospholipase C delta